MPVSDSTAASVPPSSRNSVPQLMLVALGFTFVDLIWVVKPAAEPTQRAVYHWGGDTNSLFLAVILDFLILAGALALLLVMARKPGRLRASVWVGLLVSLPWVLYMDSRLLLHKLVYRKISYILFWGALLAISWIVARWRPSFASTLDRILGPFATIMACLGLFTAFLLCRLVWFDWQAHTLDARSVLHHPQASEVPQPHRIIWIVFDELSYWQLYEKRFPGLQMPAFDSLAAQSTNFTQVVPIDVQTEVVLPGLFTGKSLDDIKTSPSGKLLLHNGQTNQWQAFDQHDTIFQDALNAGYSTGVAGWYNPYCHILPGVLDRCTWAYRFPISNAMTMSATVLTNAIAPLNVVRYILLTAGPFSLQRKLMRSSIPGSGLSLTELRLQDFAELQGAAHKLVSDPNAGFVLIHLPVPHPNGFYDRATGKLRTTGSYVDNLALADRCLADIKNDLTQLGQWDSSTVIVMGDHGWRTELYWKFGDADTWTKEDRLASQEGHYDPRPAYIVKLPGQSTANRVDTPYHAANTRQLLDAIINQKITTSAGLSNWAIAVH